MMLEFCPYKPDFYSVAFEIFDSNVPEFVHDDEKEDLHRFLTKEVDGLNYFILFLNGRGVGMCGYYHDNGKNTAVLCWGLLHREFHGKKLGEKMLLYRINEIRKTSPDAKISCRTSQVTEGFFSKYGFKTVYSAENYWGKGLHLRQMELPPQ